MISIEHVSKTFKNKKGMMIMKKNSMMMTVIAVLFVVFVLVNAGLVVTYPNEYTRYYAGQLLADQNDDSIDVLAGASSSYISFRKLAAAALEQKREEWSRGERT